MLYLVLTNPPESKRSWKKVSLFWAVRKRNIPIKIARHAKRFLIFHLIIFLYVREQFSNAFRTLLLSIPHTDRLVAKPAPMCQSQSRYWAKSWMCIDWLWMKFWRFPVFDFTSCAIPIYLSAALSNLMHMWYLQISSAPFQLVVCCAEPIKKCTTEGNSLMSETKQLL